MIFKREYIPYASGILKQMYAWGGKSLTRPVKYK